MAIPMVGGRAPLAIITISGGVMPSFAHHCLNFDGFFFFGSSILSRDEESSAACSLSSELALLAAFSSARDFSGTGSAIAPSLMEPVALRRVRDNKQEFGHLLRGIPRTTQLGNEKII
jgi:hypothetical protein